MTEPIDTDLFFLVLVSWVFFTLILILTPMVFITLFAKFCAKRDIVQAKKELYGKDKE